MKFLAYPMIFLVKLYQKLISPRPSIENTLTEKDIEPVQENIINKLISKFNIELRST